MTDQTRTDPPCAGAFPSGERENNGAVSASGNLRQALFSPRSVAIVGQSDDAGKTAGRPLKFLRQMGYGGRVYPINTRRETVLGERAWPSLEALPEAPDHVYVVTPTDAAVAAVEACARLGVKVATVLADGFAEAGAQGIAREARLRDACAQTGIRIVGPSSLGVVDLRSKAMLTANAAFDEIDLPVGRILAASHSGSLIGALLSRGKARGIGFAGLVSVGNEVDLSLGEICQATLDDPGIDGYMLFLETMRHADALHRFALAAAQRGKPVAAYKLGRSAAARELALTHTGALAGEDDVADVFLAACGIARVDTLDGLLEGLPLLARVPASRAARKKRRRGDDDGRRRHHGGRSARQPRRRRRAGERRDAGAARRRRDSGQAGPPHRPHHCRRPLRHHEIRTRHHACRAGIRSRARRRRVLGAGAAARNRAADHRQRGRKKAAGGVSRARRAGGTGGARPRRRAEFPHARGLRRRHCGGARTAPAAPVAVRAKPQDAGGGRIMDELAAGKLLDRLGIDRAPSIALDADITAAPDLPFAYPVVVKVLAAETPHKTDIGGVVLGIDDDEALLAAMQELRANVAERLPGATVARMLVQPMLRGLGEALVGYRVDRDVGPLVMVAAGGVLAEIAGDRSLRLAPVDLASARAMVAEVRGLIALSGYRGRPKGDLDALAEAIVALSQLAHDPTVAEAEINPLIVLPPAPASSPSMPW